MHLRPDSKLLEYFRLIPESPRWLLSRNRTREAEKIILKCARVNGVKFPDHVIDKATTEEGGKHSILKMFTSPRLLIRTLVICLNW